MEGTGGNMHEGSALRLSSHKKPGRPRKYDGGWLSVKNHLVKQIKLHTKVYVRWCRLKGLKQHSEFATILLDLYESVHCSTRGFSIAHQYCINPVAVVSTTDLQPRISTSHKLEGRHQRNVVPMTIDCYEDTQYTINPQRPQSGTSQNTRVARKQLNVKKMKLSKGQGRILIPHLSSSISEENVIVGSPPEGHASVVPLLTAVSISDMSCDGVSCGTSGSSLSNTVSIPNSDTTHQIRAKCGTATPFEASSVVMSNLPVGRVPDTNSEEKRTDEPENINSNNKKTLNPFHDKSVPAETSRTIENIYSQSAGTSSSPVVSQSLFENMNVAEHSLFSDSTTSSVSYVPTVGLISFLDSPSKSAVSDLAVTMSERTLQMYSSVPSMKDITVTQTADNITRSVNLPLFVIQSEDNVNQPSLVHVQPKETLAPAPSSANSYSTATETRTTQSAATAKTAAVGVGGHNLKSSELAVAKIISSLSDSLNNGSPSLDGAAKIVDKRIIVDNYKETSLLCCSNSCGRKRSLVGGAKKIFQKAHVRHMSTQFTTEVPNIKRCRTVSTQTVCQTFMVSKQTETEHELFRRSIQTQYWPSPLWTKFLNRHPEVIYNIDLHDQPEFPGRIRLYRKRGKLYSTLFGSKFELQRKPGMRCISVAEFGGPEVLRLLSSIPTPKPVGKQVLVNVKAAGVNPVDTYIRSGTYAASPKLPYTPGKDGAGIIQQVGEAVTKVKKGDRVWFYGSLTGSYAEYCVVDEDNVDTLPLSLTFEEGAMIGTPYLTAYRALFQKGKLQRGETVFIHGASGGVGTAAVQICKSCGVRVIGTAGSPEGIELLKNMGVDAVYNHREPSYVEEVKKNETQIDMILEMLANVNLDHDLQLVRRLTGRIVVIGSRGPIEINPRLIMTNEATVTGIVLVNSSSEEKAEQIHYVSEGMKNGWVKPILWKVMELENAKDAHREIIENKGAKGQIVLKVNPSLNAPEYVPVEL